MLILILAVTILLHPGKPPRKAGPSVPGDGNVFKWSCPGGRGHLLANEVVYINFSQSQGWGIVPFCMPRGGE